MPLRHRPAPGERVTIRGAIHTVTNSRRAPLGPIRPLPDDFVARVRAACPPPPWHAGLVAPGPGDAVFERELARVARAPEGDRNRTLNRAAFVAGLLVGSGRLDRAAAECGLLAAAAACGLPPQEASDTAHRAVEAGVRRATA